MEISIIAAVARNRVIGRDNELPWRLADDLKRFKALTMDHHLLVGRKTWESIGRPLPGREIIVVTGQRLELPEHVHTASSVEEGIDTARDYDESELFVAGGASIFAAALPLCERMYMTHVEADVPGDVYFPVVDLSSWNQTVRQTIDGDDRNEYPTTFVTYEREVRQ